LPAVAILDQCNGSHCPCLGEESFQFVFGSGKRQITNVDW
jgi:hypothetical protein